MTHFPFPAPNDPANYLAMHLRCWRRHIFFRSRLGIGIEEHENKVPINCAQHCSITALAKFSPAHWEQPRAPPTAARTLRRSIFAALSRHSRPDHFSSSKCRQRRRRIASELCEIWRFPWDAAPHREGPDLPSSSSPSCACFFA